MHFCKVRCRGVIIHDSQLLVVKHSGGRDFYALPGGHLNFGEDPLDCIRRELTEELGVVPEIGKLFCVYSFVNSEGIQSIEFFFEVKNASAFREHAKREKSHAHEVEEVRWISRTEETKLLPEEFMALFKNGNFEQGKVTFIKSLDNIG